MSCALSITPCPDLRVEMRQPEPGLVEAVLHNAGDADAPLAVNVTLRWDGADPLARDVLAGFESAESVSFRWVLRTEFDTHPPVLPPGERRMIAWMRFAEGKETQAHVTPCPP